MVNRRGQPIMAHTIIRHVTIPPADVAGRVVRGLGMATGFLNAAVMQEAVMVCLENRATEINDAFNRGATGSLRNVPHRDPSGTD